MCLFFFFFKFRIWLKCFILSLRSIKLNFTSSYCLDNTTWPAVKRFSSFYGFSVSGVGLQNISSWIMMELYRFSRAFVKNSWYKTNYTNTKLSVIIPVFFFWWRCMLFFFSPPQITKSKSTTVYSEAERCTVKRKNPGFRTRLSWKR